MAVRFNPAILSGSRRTGAGLPLCGRAVPCRNATPIASAAAAARVNVFIVVLRSCSLRRSVSRPDRARMAAGARGNTVMNELENDTETTLSKRDLLRGAAALV